MTRPDQRAGAGLRFCFAEEGLRDDFYHALLNVAAGRAWNAPQVDAADWSSAPAGSAASGEQRRFEIEVRDSVALPDGTQLEAILAADLPALCLSVSAQVWLLSHHQLPSGRRGALPDGFALRLEMLDRDFDDWVGPLVLGDIPHAGSSGVGGGPVVVRVRPDDGAEKQTQQLRLQPRQPQQQTSRETEGGLPAVIPVGRRMM